MTPNSKAKKRKKKKNVDPIKSTLCISLKSFEIAPLRAHFKENEFYIFPQTEIMSIRNSSQDKNLLFHNMALMNHDLKKRGPFFFSFARI